MKRRETIYNLGNDYFQDTEVYFATTEDQVKELSGKAPVYSDGLYHYTTKPVYELSGGASALNKRIFNVPQTDWKDADFPGFDSFSALPDASAVFSPDYATGVVVDPDTTDKKWEKPV